MSSLGRPSTMPVAPTTNGLWCITPTWFQRGNLLLLVVAPCARTKASENAHEDTYWHQISCRLMHPSNHIRYLPVSSEVGVEPTRGQEPTTIGFGGGDSRIHPATQAYGFPCTSRSFDRAVTLQQSLTFGTHYRYRVYLDTPKQDC